MDCNQLAQYFGVNRVTVRRWLQDGVPHNRPQKISFDVKAVEVWLEDNNKRTRGGQAINADTA